MKAKEVEKVLDKMKKVRALVVGDIGLDSYIVGNVKRISPEAPVPVVEVTETYHRLGLAANVVSNIIALGAKADLIGVIGNDPNANHMRDALMLQGVNINGLVVDPVRPTTHKTRVLAGKLHHVVRIDREDKKKLPAEIKNEIMHRFLELLVNVDIVILEDYEKGLFKEGLVQEMIKLCREKNIHVFVDPSRYINPQVYTGATLIKPNRDEAELMARMELHTEEDIIACGNKILNELNIEYLVLSRGKDGVTIFSKKGKVDTIPAFQRNVYDVSGAGDTMIATLALAFACGENIHDAAYIANAASAVVVSKVGTDIATPDEVIAVIKDMEEKE
jgi:rfaE bifunctional protein kinase chain/domain